MKHETFVARIFDTEQIFQDVVCYITDIYGEDADVLIRMPLLVKPSSIRSDVAEALREFDATLHLDYLKFELCPENITLAP